MWKVESSTSDNTNFLRTSKGSDWVRKPIFFKKKSLGGFQFKSNDFKEHGVYETQLLRLHKDVRLVLNCMEYSWQSIFE